MRFGRYFLPDTPDVVGLLRAQIAVTIDGIDAFAAWAGGDETKAEAVREAEHAGEAAKREVLEAVRAAFVTPMEPEDLFALSRGVGWILNHARSVVRESQVMQCQPDAGIAGMGRLLAEALRHIDQAIAALGDGGEAIRAADAAIETERRLDRSYLDGMAALLDVKDMRERIARRELYRRCAGLGDIVIDVADRVVYAVVKES